MAVFPPEILLPILIPYIQDPQTSLYNALSLRLFSRAINAEVLHQLFTLGELDVKDVALRVRHLNAPRWCRLCEVAIRPERRHTAINRVTMHRYLVAWLIRDYNESYDRQRNSTYSADEQEVRRLWETMTGAVKLYEETARTLSTESLFVSVQTDGTNKTRSKLADAAITLFGVRVAWTYFGPHHITVGPHQISCRLQRYPELPTIWWYCPGTACGRRDRWTETFWCLIMAAHDGDLDMVLYFLNGLGMGPESDWAGYVETLRRSKENECMLDDCSKQTSYETLKRWGYQVICLAAALTIAVRSGRRELISLLLEKGMTRQVCCETRFWNGRTVLGTLLAATADDDPKISELAVSTIYKLIAEWTRGGLYVQDRMWCVEHLRFALKIPTRLGALLLQVIQALLPGSSDTGGQEICNRLLFNLLCQAALTNDVLRAELAAKITSLESGKIVVNSPKCTAEDAYAVDMAADEDEYGVRCNRLMNVLNPLRIAAALSHREILEWLLAPLGRQLLDSVKPWQLRATKSTGYLKLGKQVASQVAKESVLLDARREAVRDVFINSDRLPIDVRSTVDVKALELILSRSQDLNWGLETIKVAETQNTDVFRVFVDHTDLGKQVPRSMDRVGQSSHVKDGLACTVGEKSLQCALKAGRFDNAKILLEKCPVLADTIHPDDISLGDPEAMDTLRAL